MMRFIILAIVAAAVVLGLHSGSLLIALGAICGACGVTSLAATARAA